LVAAKKLVRILNRWKGWIVVPDFKEGRNSQILLPILLLKPSGSETKRNYTVSGKTPNEAEEKAALKGSAGMSRLRGSARCCLRVKHTGARHSSLERSLSRFNFVTTAECECGDGLQTGEGDMSSVTVNYTRAKVQH
jgi:hypothetical protein